MAYQSILNPMPAILSGGTNVIGALTANQSVNHTQLAGTAIATGTGVSGAGVQRMTLATDIALPAGGNVIGAVTQSGTWNIGAIATLPALTTGAAVIGAVTQSGTWNVGTITTLPALPTGGNVIGSVTQSGTWNVGTITTLPALATGANTIGNVGLIAGAAAIGTVGVTTLPALVAGAALIGKVGIDQTTPGSTNLVSIGTNGTVALNAALPIGANTIGNVALVAGAAAIGSVSVTALPALVAGSAIIGSAKITDGTFTVGIAAGAAAGSETSLDRLKVNAEVKILDTNQPAGSQIVAAKGDQVTGLWVNVKSAGETPDLYFLNAILTELKVISTLLQVGLSVNDDPGTLRDDYSNQLN